MKRRDFLTLAGAAAAFPRVALAQQAAKVPRIAYLYTVPVTGTTGQAFIQGLADVGYVDGKNITIDYYVAPNDAEIPAYAARAVASKPDLIVAMSSPASLALKALGTSIPVVFTIVADPVAIGVVDSYNHPGGNMTGTMLSNLDLIGKQFEILREILPSIKRIAFFGQPDDPPYAIYLAQATAAAKALAIDLNVIEIKEGDDFVAPFDRAVKGGAEGVCFMRVTYFLNDNAAILARLAIERRLPSVGAPNHAQMGALVGYGGNTARVVRDAAPYIDAILKGAKPADMPVGQPTSLDFVINQKTAKALSVTFPQSVVLRATEVIE